MAEGMSKQEIEQGIKKLINLGGGSPKVTEDSSITHQRKDLQGNQKHHDLHGNLDRHQSPDGKKKKKNKNKKTADSKTGNEDRDHTNNPDKRQKTPKKPRNQKPETPVTKTSGPPKELEETDILKPGLIISVNDQSKRQITAYLNENKEGVKTAERKAKSFDTVPEKDGERNAKSMDSVTEKDGERKPKSMDTVTVDAKGNVLNEKKIKKRRKKGKKKATDSSGDEDDDKKTQSSPGQKPDQNIDEAVKKFWSMKIGEGHKTQAVKTTRKVEKSGNEADDEKGQNEELNLDLSDLDDDISVDVLLQILERDRIFPLKKKSIRFPRARFFCRVCDYHMDTTDDVRRHGKDHRHQRRVDNIKIQEELKRMTPPSAEQIKALDSLLEKIYEQHHMTTEVLEERNNIVANLEIFLKKIIPAGDVKLKIFGSSFSGLGLINSDVNLDFEVQKDHAKHLTMAFKAMKESDEYEHVISDFTSKVPCIYFTIKDTKYRITISSEPSRNTSLLLKLYGRCDHRFAQLAVVFRYWAKICKIDRQDEGTLPAYSFFLLLIFYLQRCKPPVLPILYQCSDELRNMSPMKNKPLVKTEEMVDFDELADIADEWKSENTDSLGSLWLGLLKFYVLGFELNTYVVCIRQLEVCTRAQKKWNSKKLAIEDPFSQKRNVCKSVVSFELFEYIWDCLRKAYRYFGQPTNIKMLKQIRKKKHSSKHSPCKQNRKAEDKLCSESVTVNSTDKIDSVEDPLSKTGNESVACSETSHVTSREQGSNEAEILKDENSDIEGENHENLNKQTCNHGNHVEMSVKETQTVTIPRHVWSVATMSSFTMTTSTRQLTYHHFDKSVTTTSDSNASKPYDLEHVCNKYDNCDSNQKHDSLQSSEPITQFAKCIVESVLEGALASLNVSECSNQKDDIPSELTDKEPVDRSDIVVSENQAIVTNVSVEEGEIKEESEPQYNYEFLYSILTDGKGPAVYCSLCEKEGHLSHCCPDEVIPELSPLPKITKSHKDMLSTFIKVFPREFGPTDGELREREMIRRELEEFIRELYPDAALHLFGSSHNGFGFRNSDLDLCVSFDKHQTGENLDLVFCIENICCKLKTHRGLYNVFPITTAKVPIVKFRHRRSQLEGDISMYNLLALQNTEMVRMYAAMDPRVRTLGYALKVFVKLCDIGDASRGSLSSYAYILMLLHYLQQCKPPVIPVLQELYHHYGPEKPELMIDGWNAWYFDNMKTLPDVWLEYGKNHQSVGELWLGLFRYYTEEFNMKEQVVCCRQTEVLTKFEKLWNSPCMAIEDPFDFNHNLGGGLSRKMHQYINKALIKGRELFGTPRPDLEMNWDVLYGYYFDPVRLSDGPPPNDRCCRVCNKIGHIAKECPVVKNRKEREDKDRKRKAEQRIKEEEIKKKLYQENGNYNNGRNGNERSGNTGKQRDQNSYVRERGTYRGNVGKQNNQNSYVRERGTYRGNMRKQRDKNSYVRERGTYRENMGKQNDQNSYVRERGTYRGNVGKQNDQNSYVTERGTYRGNMGKQRDQNSYVRERGTYRGNMGIQRDQNSYVRERGTYRGNMGKQRDQNSYVRERGTYRGNMGKQRDQNSYVRERGTYSGNIGKQRDQNSYVRKRVIHRTISESRDQQYYMSQPMTIPQSQAQMHRSLSLPSGHHGHYSPMSSPQAYHGFPQNLSPLQHSSSPQQYRQDPHGYQDNHGVTRSLFNQSEQYRSSPGRSSASGNQQVPVSACQQPLYVISPQQQLSGGLAEGFLLPVHVYNPAIYHNMSDLVIQANPHATSPPSSNMVLGNQPSMTVHTMSDPVRSGMANPLVSSPTSPNMVLGNQPSMTVQTESEKQQRKNNRSNQQNSTNNPYTESSQRNTQSERPQNSQNSQNQRPQNSQNPRPQNSMFRQAEQYYQQARKY